MIQKIEISGSNYKVEENLRKYITKKIGKLDRYLPRAHKRTSLPKSSSPKSTVITATNTNFLAPAKSQAAKSSPLKTNVPTSTPA